MARLVAPATGARWTGGCVDAKIEGLGFARVGFCLEILRRAIHRIALAENGHQRRVCGEKCCASKQFEVENGTTVTRGGYLIT